MKRIGILAYIFMWVAGNMSAQDYFTSEDFNVRLSKPFRVVDARSKIYLNSDKHVVSFKIEKTNQFVIQSFDVNDLHEISHAENEFEDRNSDFESFVRVDDRFYAFYTLYDKSNEIENLYAQEIDGATSKFTGIPKKLLSIEGKIAGTLTRGYRVTDKFHFVTSKSGGKLLVNLRMKPEKRNDDISHDRIGLYVFDTDLKKLWGDTREMKYTEAQMDIEDYGVDSVGNAYILAKIFKDGNKDQKRRKDETVNYSFELMKLTGTNDIVERQTLDLDNNRFVKSAIFDEQDKDHLVIAGYYRNASSFAVDGAFVFILDKNTNTFVKKYYAIPIDIINAYASKRETRHNDKDEEDGEAGIEHLVLDQIHIDKEGNLTLIGEEFQVKSRTTTSSTGGSHTSYTYYYSDILVTKVLANGELAWMRKIPKNQIGGSGKGGMSYSTLFNDDNLYVLYLDNVKNFELAKDESPKAHKDGAGGFLTSAKINYKTGAVTKEHLFDLRDVEGIEAFQFSTDRIINLKDDEIAVEVYKKKKEDVWILVGLN